MKLKYMCGEVFIEVIYVEVTCIEVCSYIEKRILLICKSNLYYRLASLIEGRGVLRRYMSTHDNYTCNKISIGTAAINLVVCYTFVDVRMHIVKCVFCIENLHLMFLALVLISH